MDKPLWGLRVQAPLGARVLSFVCCAPNDGFSPQSGLVQRGVLYAAAWGSENRTTGLRPWEMHRGYAGWRFTGFAGRGAPYESSSLATAGGGTMDA